MSPQNFCPPFPPKILLFSKKLLNENILKTLFPIKKVIFIFVAKSFLPFKRDLVPGNGFCHFFRKLQLFLNKLLNNKIFNTSFVIEKVILIFGVRRLLSQNNCQMCPQKSFSQFSRKILLFLKKLLNKKYSVSNF